MKKERKAKGERGEEKDKKRNPLPRWFYLSYVTPTAIRRALIHDLLHKLQMNYKELHFFVHWNISLMDLKFLPTQRKNKEENRKKRLNVTFWAV